MLRITANAINTASGSLTLEATSGTSSILLSSATSRVDITGTVLNFAQQVYTIGATVATGTVSIDVAGTAYNFLVHT